MLTATTERGGLMTKLSKKLRSDRGETFVEMLVSMALLALAVSIMAGMMAAAYRLNSAAKIEDGRYQQELSAAENPQGEPVAKGTVVIRDISGMSADVTIDVDLFGGSEENGLRSYSPS